MNTEVYSRNYLYISSEQQKKIKKKKILLAGCGIGSNIAECALRLGFENITLIDGDKVELTNINRQNYSISDIGKYKTEALKHRLLDINPDANIIAQNAFLTPSNVEGYLTGHDIAINALDFQSNIPFLFDELCQHKGISVLHPYNLGWATMLFAIVPNGENLRIISDDYLGFEKKVVRFFIDKLQDNDKEWVTSVLTQYDEKYIGQSPPQLSIGSWLAGAACTRTMYLLSIGEPIKIFPDFYFTSSLGS